MMNGWRINTTYWEACTGQNSLIQAPDFGICTAEATKSQKITKKICRLIKYAYLCIRIQERKLLE